MSKKREKASHDVAWTNLGQLMVRQVDGASLAAFRICFGAVVCYHAVKSLWPVNGTSYVNALFTGTDIHFKYPGFSWLPVWPEPWMTVVVVILAVSAAMLAMGLLYRLSAIALFLSWTYFFLAEASVYNNHYYLMVLIALLLIFMPAHRCFSVDRLRLRFESHLVPFWPIFLLRFQLFVVYSYGGIAKFNADWLAGLVVIRQGKMIYEFLGEPAFLSAVSISLLLAWVGLFYDLLVGFLLIWRRTRLMALAMTLFLPCM